MAETAEKSKAANEEAAKAKQALDTANAELKTATDKKTAADKAVADADTAAKNAAAAAEQAKKASAEKPDDASLKTAAENADKSAAETAAKLKTAQDEQAAAQKAVEEAQVKQKVAEEAKTKADMAMQATQSLAQQAQQMKQQADQFAQQKQNEANPRGVNYWAPSTPVTIRIVDFPITVEGPPAQATVKQGAMLEMPVKVTRLYGFDQQVNFQLILPGGVGGIGIQNFQVPNGQTDGKFTLNAQANATVGTHNLTVRVQMNWNGQNLQFDRPVALTVEEVKTQ
jgi:multidrug efflux pump subunit AcrA (membrane-fusion protein)